MSRRLDGTPPPARLALAGAATVCVSALAWRGFTEAWAATLVPLVGLGLVVALGGTALRRLRVPPLLVPLGQSLLGLAGLCLVLTGSPLPLGAAADELSRSFVDAVATSVAYAAPVPAGAPGIHPLLLTGGLACLLLVDLAACTLRRVPLAGLPLLAVHSVPISVLGSTVSWWVFALGAAGFLLMLYLDTDDAVTRWGRAVPDAGPQGRGGPGAARPAAEAGFGVRTGAARGSAGAVGAVATGLALIVPLALPVLSLEVFDIGPGAGPGEGTIDIENPMVDLRRDLKRGPDVPLVRVRTDQPDPGYLRISVLTAYTADEWTSGDRDVPPDQAADGALPPIEGLSPRVPRDSYPYEVQTTEGFRSTWLPTQAPVSRVSAPGDWRYDSETLDFLAAPDGLDAAGERYEMTAVVPRLDAADLARARGPQDEVSTRFLQLPDALPSIVTREALRITSGLDNDFAKAVALQDWFREDGGFRYDLARSEDGNGTDQLAAFLSPEGRVGYCEQFAASMAVMAREVGIPARVAVGFLRPTRLPDGRWEYSAYDLHAWPELYFPGAGWTRFEPTPATRASGVPDYTEQQVGTDPARQTAPATSARPEPAPARPEPRSAPQDATAAGAGGGRVGVLPWRRVLVAALAVALLAALVVAPGVVRRRRRERRLVGDAEQCWAELRDTALDLGLAWPEHRSPRETARVVDEHLAGEAGARAALTALVTAVERARYARAGGGTRASAGTADATRVCLGALATSAGPRRARRARWWPRTGLRLTLRRRRGASTPPRGPAPEGTLEHLG